jgi:hypothetical protein
MTNSSYANPVFSLVSDIISGVEQRMAQRIPERDLNPPGRSLTTAETNALEAAMEERAMFEAHEGKDIFLEWVAEQANVIADYAAYRRATCDPQEWDELQREIGI